MKFELKDDYRKPITFAIDQVNYRFVDETMLGSYEYPAIKWVLTQVVTENFEGRTWHQQAYVHGEREANTHVMSPFEEGLPAGTYIMMYQGEFTNEHPERKLVASIYAQIDIPIVALDDKSYAPDKWESLDYALYEQF